MDSEPDWRARIADSELNSRNGNEEAAEQTANDGWTERLTP